MSCTDPTDNRGRSRPRVLFLGALYGGHTTRFFNLRAHTRNDPRISPTYRTVTGWVPRGTLERLPIIPKGLKGRARAVLQTAPLAGFPRPDVIWTSVGPERAGYLWSLMGPLRRPVVYDCDGTLELQEHMAAIYSKRPPKSGLSRFLADAVDRALTSTVTLFIPWSRWAADSLRRQGIAEDRIHVLPPGVDLQEWRPRPELRAVRADKLRLLFVGADFARKGGDLLLNVFRERFADRCELDVVTRDAIESSRNVRVHRAEPNSTLLRELYARADLFVMPTRADFFGIATVEAMACGLPVIAGDVGAAREIVDHGETGWIVEPTGAALAEALERALDEWDHLPGMGRRARAVAEERFNGQRNDSQIVEALIAVANQHQTATAPLERTT